MRERKRDLCDTQLTVMEKGLRLDKFKNGMREFDWPVSKFRSTPVHSFQQPPPCPIFYEQQNCCVKSHTGLIYVSSWWSNISSGGPKQSQSRKSLSTSWPSRKGDGIVCRLSSASSSAELCSLTDILYATFLAPEWTDLQWTLRWGATEQNVFRSMSYRHWEIPTLWWNFGQMVLQLDSPGFDNWERDFVSLMALKSWGLLALVECRKEGGREKLLSLH